MSQQPVEMELALLRWIGTWRVAGVQAVAANFDISTTKQRACSR